MIQNIFAPNNGHRNITQCCTKPPPQFIQRSKRKAESSLCYASKFSLQPNPVRLHDMFPRIFFLECFWSTSDTKTRMCYPASLPPASAPVSKTTMQPGTAPHGHHIDANRWSAMSAERVPHCSGVGTWPRGVLTTRAWKQCDLCVIPSGDRWTQVEGRREQIFRPSA